MSSTHEEPSTSFSAVIRALRDRVDGDVLFDNGSRAAYSTDASNFRQVPIGVVAPRTIEAAVETVAICHEYQLPIVSRGGGTSLAGQCTNEAVVIDFSRYCNRIVSYDVDARRCVVESGIVLDDLNAQLAPTGLRFGPEPATHANCTLGGMIGNNSCGATAQRTGKVVDNIASLEVLLHDGTQFVARQLDDDEYAEVAARTDRIGAIQRELRALGDEHAELIRRRYPDIPRRVSGYNLDSLLPEHGFDLAGFLVGSESTLVTVLRAELELVPVVRERTLVVLGFDDIASAGDAVSDIVEHEPIALEGVDHYLVHDQELKDMNGEALDELPDGTGFLMVQFGGDTTREADGRAEEMLQAIGKGDSSPNVVFYDDPDREHELWMVREAGLGATAHVPGHRDTFEGWEDSAVPVDRLGDYLRDLDRLFKEFDYSSDAGPSLYGHFGQGCIHTRIPFDLYSADGVAQYRKFLEQAADLVASYGGSLSGEHGDGQTRGELLPRMFGPEVVRLFEQVKGLFDPDELMNPGKVVHPARLDEHLRLGADWAPRQPRPLNFAFPDDGHSFSQAANRCVGVGKCRQLSPEGGAVMCPSYQVTREERHSTRGRSRLLFEMLNGHGDGPIQDGWRSEEVRDALDLCLACKGCKSDCPASVDMATYKAEFLSHHYAGRLRPRADYATGWLPVAARAVARLRLARPLNRLSSVPSLRRVGTRLAGLEDREVPAFAPTSLQRWWRQRSLDGHHTGERGRVLLWPDTFTNYFHPEVGRAAVKVLESAGWEVSMPEEPLCCGLTWISTGQLTQAKRRLGQTVAALAEHVRSGGLVVGLEPSCTAVFRSDAPDLLNDEPDVNRLRDQTVTFAELLQEHSYGWEPPRLDAGRSVNALAQVHCHQHAVLGWDADRDLLERAGVDAERLSSGCCGLAGNFGFTAGHGEVSEACAEQVLLPRIRESDPETVVLADGFSCRTQVHELADGREAVHLAQLIAGGLSNARHQDHDERSSR
ncbi:MAG TPA: FAD-binding and (Fe-S)-binding domain-containing protein [Nocardioidaceae bacterium]|nr:FAD-binding and (Fe-S)-binding domain-containing protein [Nocardioidaceae bacterium]